MADLEEKHQKQVELIKTELEMASKNSSSRENEVTNSSGGSESTINIQGGARNVIPSYHPIKIITS